MVAKYTFFSSAHGTFSRTDHLIGHKTSLIKSKKIEIISSIFYHHNGIKVEINSRRKIGKFKNMWKLNNTLLNNYFKGLMLTWLTLKRLPAQGWIRDRCK